MSGDGLKIEGLQALQDKLLELAGAVGGAKELARISRKAMKPVLADAKALVPKDTELLGDSLIIVSRKPKSGTVVASAGLKVKVGNDYRQALKGYSKKIVKRTLARSKRAKRITNRKSAHWRWHFIERGTSKKSARPFLRPAFARNMRGMLDTVKSELNKTIKRIARKKAKAAKKG